MILSKTSFWKRIKMSSKVAVVKGERSIETVEKALSLIDGLDTLSNKPVLIKVNFITTKTWETGATTDPIVVEALIKAIQTRNSEVYVVEANATSTNADKAAESTGMLDLCKRCNAPFLNLSKVEDRVVLQVKDHEALSQITVPKIVANSWIVSAAKMKTHSETQVTLGLKNMFGLLPDRMKWKYHLRGIGKVIVDINTVLRPALTVIDGFVAMEGSGPVRGTPVKMDLIVAGRNAVSTDSIASRIMGFDPKSIYHIRRTAEKGLGEIDNIETVGERIETVARRFTRA
jgi:uncharacterized protein (DUF362 family)